MSRVHAITVLVAVAAHVLVAAPWLRRTPTAKSAAPRPMTELPIEVAAAPAEPPARRAKRAKPQATSAPVPKPVAPTTPAKHTAPAPTANPAPAAPAAATSPAATTSPAKSPSIPREPLAFVALANQPLVGESSTGALLIHSANLRESALGADLAKQLRAHTTLAALFEGAFDPLRDCDQLLLARSADNGLGLLLVQYNAARYKVRVAAAQSGADYTLPARDLLAFGGGAQAFAASVAKDFRLPEGAEDEALSAYAKPPQTLTLSALPHPARWLTLHVRDDGSGSLLASAADDASVDRTTIAKSELKALVSELLAAFR